MKVVPLISYEIDLGIRYISDIPYIGYGFILGRPREKDWSEFDGSTMKQGREDWRPIMIRGINSGQTVKVHGSAYGYKLDDFEITGPLTVHDPRGEKV